jgi:hypothetical protein
MLYRKIIQDSDDDESLGSDAATSVDPLQDEVPCIAASGNLNLFDNPEGKQIDWTIGHSNEGISVGANTSGPPSSRPPHMDFDQYLQSQPSFWGQQDLAPLFPPRRKIMNKEGR